MCKIARTLSHGIEFLLIGHEVRRYGLFCYDSLDYFPFQAGSFCDYVFCDRS